MGDSTLRTTLDPELREWAGGRLHSKIHSDARPPSRAATHFEASARELIKQWHQGGRTLRAQFPTLGDYLREHAWNNSPELRDEFGDADSGFERFLAFAEMESRGATHSPQAAPGVVGLDEAEIAEIRRVGRDKGRRG